MDKTRALLERELVAIREIAELLIPESFNVYGFNKETVIDGLLDNIREGPDLIGLKMKMVYKILKRCYEG